MRYDIKNLNIWKDEPNRNRALVRNKYKTISNKGTVYPVFLGDAFLGTDIESLNLSVRSYHCLRRQGWNTVGDIVNNISSIEDILRLRNCGRTSSEEIFNQIIKLQKSLIPESDQNTFAQIFFRVNDVAGIDGDRKG